MHSTLVPGWLRRGESGKPSGALWVVFDPTTKKRTAAFEHDQSVNDIAYPPPGRFIATAWDDTTVCLWTATILEDPHAESKKRDAGHDSLCWDLWENRKVLTKEDEDGQIPGSRTRPIYAFVTEPPPDEIERRCFCHLTSYIGHGQRDPNINTVENSAHAIVSLLQSERGPALTRSCSLEVFNRLLERFHCRKPSPSAITAPLSFSTQPATPIDDVNNGASDFCFSSVAAVPEPMDTVIPPTETIRVAEAIDPRSPRDDSMFPAAEPQAVPLPAMYEVVATRVIRQPSSNYFNQSGSESGRYYPPPADETRPLIS
ncbi:hypothetical protein PAXINDRAFT_17960 [Paxillus involutus ATCC 200175]|uniref:Uncharacterized protein n=1 Tax=Paxillus involutus ATCC 200175 TaxID=664439 RepID=A0A0C9TMB4_PAXIN|nr:hypothetical protein PAXINDRAFT_17960 [Paxillus involutus ATCC 200175]